MPDTPTSIRVPEDLAAALAARGETASGTIRRDLARYYAMLRDSRADLARVLTRPEICLVLDALNGILHDEHGYRFLWAEVADAIRLNALDQKWKVEDPDDLVRRLRALSPGHTMALVDAAEQFWRRCDEDTDAVLLDLGLVVAREHG